MTDTTPPPAEDLRAVMARRAQRVLAPTATATPLAAPTPTVDLDISEKTKPETGPESSPAHMKFKMLAEIGDLSAHGRGRFSSFRTAESYDRDISLYYRLYVHSRDISKAARLVASQLEIDDNTHLVDQLRLIHAWGEMHNKTFNERCSFTAFMTDEVKTAHLLRGGGGITGYIQGLGRKLGLGL